MGKRAWNGWYHVMGHTYGTWLPGDPRGFRTRRHREHIEGDYKNPPPEGKYDERHERARRSMKRDPVYLTREQRRRAVVIVSESLRKRKLDVIIIAIDRVHLHILARFPGHDPRKWVGIAKKESSAYMKQEGLAPEGGLWAVRTKCKPIADRAHQLNVAEYLRQHASNRAVLWRCDRNA